MDLFRAIRMTAIRRRMRDVRFGRRRISYSLTRTCFTPGFFLTIQNGLRLFENLKYLVIDELHLLPGRIRKPSGKRSASAKANL